MWLFKKTVARNSETGFPIPDEETMIVNKIAVVITATALLAVMIWSTKHGKKA